MKLMIVTFTKLLMKPPNDEIQIHMNPAIPATVAIVTFE